MAGLARQTVQHNVTVNNLLPGPFETDRLLSTIRTLAAKQNIPFEKLYEERRKENPAKRMGAPDEFGAACAFLCSAHAGFITGQNLLLDGGAYRGTL